ncbi:5-oxoprolinase subunit PxpB [Paenibacillus oceani]|uniref:5-oxoprolinase subunit PxpB n=1 Tax=Paenibacillus oceani TaxID=2772510 RepID=A0A927CCT6_9BACL|nr:5-oxoprolinase subunit PxpB [Paenibacillus oceani]MBD2863485.1 5-oxoprolinase subunit PxpB [Paenibacillus oceani]
MERRNMEVRRLQSGSTGPIIIPLGDACALVRFGERIETETILNVRGLAGRLETEPFPGFLEAVPAYAALAIYYDPWIVYRNWSEQGEQGNINSPFEAVCDAVQSLLERGGIADTAETETIVIPVCYGGDYGPDLEALASCRQLGAEEAAAVHAGADYVVAMIGFTPGFPYLAGLPDELATPRRDTPRPLVEAGSVGIAGTQTGLYPQATPGGWNLIGRTPLALFRPHDQLRPSLLRPGDRVRFEAITPERFEELAASENKLGQEQPPAGGSAVVIKSGLLATVQDGGRLGHQRIGVSVSGPMDGFAHRTANALVGNAPDAAALELTLAGFALRLDADSLVAVTGGGALPTVDGRPLPAWRPVFVRRGSVLAFARVADGCRAYLAVAGGFAVPAVLGSRSTHVPARLGGLEGRPLQAGDVLPLGAPGAAAAGLLAALRWQAGNAAWAPAPWGVSPYALPAYNDHPVVRITRGPEYERFTPDSAARFGDTAFVLSHRSDRMGCRLEGPQLRMGLSGGGSMLSEPVAAGTVQVPPDGYPIVLMADRQTTGGYPRIAQVAEADMPVLAQLRPGETVRFEWISTDESQQLLLMQRLEENLIRAGIALRMREEA